MKTALIVDDNQDIRDVIASALSLEGWLIQSTDSLLGALSIVSNNNELDCVLLDYNLPGMPMEEFLKQFGAICPQTGIVLISAVDELAEKAERFGIKHYLKKPIDFEQLRTAMSACLSEGGKN